MNAWFARNRTAWIVMALVLMAGAGGCATDATIKAARTAEQSYDYDRAVVEYTKAVRVHPDDPKLRAQLQAARLRASEQHLTRARRLQGLTRLEEALVEYQIAAELNPGSGDIDRAIRDIRTKLRAKVAVDHGGRTQLETLIEQTRNLPPPGLDIPNAAALPESLVFRDASSRDVFITLARFAGVNVAFDPAFRDAPVTIEIHNSTLEDALNAVAATTRNFYRVTASNTVTIVPDTPAKRREYEEEIIRTFYLSNADLKETIDLLRIVVDNRRISPITATNAIAIKDTPERIMAAARLITAIDKARAEVVIDVELLEVDRTKLLEYGLQIASPGSDGISGTVNVNRDNFTLQDLRSLTASDVFLTGLPALYYRLIKTDTSTKALANPQLRTSEGLSAQAHFGDRVPVPVTTFAPIAQGGINQQPITSYNYENIGVNIDITPRIHYNDDVSLNLKIEISNISGKGYGDLPTFGNRQITTTIRLKDGETNMLAGLIRDDERKVFSGIPGLSELPVVGKLFANNHTEAQQTDVILVLTPHIIRVLDLNEEDLRAFRVGRETGGIVEIPTAPAVPGAVGDEPGGAGQARPILPPASPVKPPQKPGPGTGTDTPRSRN